MKTLGSLFSGIGGIDLAFNAAGTLNCGILEGVNRQSRTGATNTGPASNHERVDLSMATPDSTTLKTCRKCGEKYPDTPEYFRRAKNYKSGIATECRKCCRAAATAYRQENAQLIKERRRQFYIDNPGYSNQYTNPEQQKIRARRYHEMHKQVVLDRVRAWKIANHEQALLHDRVSAQRRRARVRRSDNHFTTEDVQHQFASQQGKCYWCECELINWEVDQYIPLSRGGSNAANNIVIACLYCNRSKHNRLPSEWEGRKS